MKRTGNTWHAIWNGVRGRCPKCGQGRLFVGFLEQVEECRECGEPLAQYESGLALSLLVLTLTTHVLGGVILELERSGLGSPGLYMIVLLPLAVVVPIALLRPCKGGLIGLFWSRNWSDVGR